MSANVSKHKTTIKVRRSLWELFSKECKAASLRRDDLLNRTLPGEIAQLEAIPACDDDGERWLKNTWLDHCISDNDVLQTAPLILTPDVLERMNAVCEAKRVPRDAFLDCALEFLTTRLYEAVIVIKDPRTSKDLVSQVIPTLADPDPSPEERGLWLQETVEEWGDKRSFVAMDADYYRRRLSYDKARVDTERMFFSL